MCMLNVNCKILGEFLVCHTAWGVNHLLIMCMLNLNCKNLGENLVFHTAWGVNHLLTMCILNLNCKILERSWSVLLHRGGLIIF